MKLDEILNKKIDYEVVEASRDVFTTVAQIGDRKIQFSVDTEDGEKWDAVFSEKAPGKMFGSYALTGSGKEFEVFSMVKDSLAEFIDRYKPAKVIFSADKTPDDETRGNLYERLLKRFKIAGYSFKRIPRLRYDDFVLIRNDD